MLKRAILIVQNHLNTLGIFSSNPDGIARSATHDAVVKALKLRQNELPAGALDFTPERRITMMLQLIAKDKNINVEPIDGYWGPVTQNAYESLIYLIDRGSLPPNWRDDEPSDANPHMWPRDRNNQKEMKDYYGQPGKPPIKQVSCPWTIRLAWNTSVRVSRIGCHVKVADSVENVLQRVHAHYGDAELKRLRLDLYGGCFNARKKRGGSTWSTHAWAVALDWDPAHNQLNWGRGRASLAASSYDFWWQAWEEEGWVSLGRSRNYDWMHVQAARL